MSGDPNQQLRRLEAHIEAQAMVLDLIGTNAPIGEILTRICEMFESEVAGSSVSIPLASDDGTTLHAGVAPNIVASFGEAMFPLEVEADAASSGSAAFLREIVIAPDISTDIAWRTRRGIAFDAGLRSCCSVPLVGSDGQLLGVFTSYWTEITDPSHGDLAAQRNYARLAQVAIERYRTQHQVSALLADERRRLAESLHDDPIQVITAVALRLQRLSRTATHDQQEQLSEIEALVGNAIERMRNMLFELHPPTLDDEGLISAVELYLYERMDPLEIEWELNDDLAETPNAAVSSLAYRLIKEALSNVASHSEATKVIVSLESDAGGMNLRIVDNGHGFDVDTALKGRAGHLGMMNSRFLAQRASGKWEIESAVDEGTTVNIWLPTGLLT